MEKSSSSESNYTMNRLDGHGLSWNNSFVCVRGGLLLFFLILIEHSKHAQFRRLSSAERLRRIIKHIDKKNANVQFKSTATKKSLNPQISCELQNDSSTSRQQNRQKIQIMMIQFVQFGGLLHVTWLGVQFTYTPITYFNCRATIFFFFFRRLFSAVSR